MVFYKRKTSFITYYINGIKNRSIGVVKQCLREEKLELGVELFGLEDWKNFSCQISVGNAGERQPLFEMNISNGMGKAEYSLPIALVNKINASKIFFSLGNDCYGIADLCEVPKYIKEDEDSVVVENEHEEKTENCENIEEENDKEQELLNDCLEEQPDKWEVIKRKYPLLYPFKGQGPYVSIKPVDLQLLEPEYHHLSNNSFLMHNFYRYKHLILGEYAWEKGTFFYVGVPGEFVKKEQNTAAMFGFEGYEYSGDRGYYLYRVKL